MGTRKLELAADGATVRRLSWAARLTGRSLDDLPPGAAEESFRRVLIAEAHARWERDELSLSELAEETGLAAEEVAQIIGPELHVQSLAALVRAGREAAADHGDEDLAALIEAAVATERQQTRRI